MPNKLRNSTFLSDRRQINVIFLHLSPIVLRDHIFIVLTQLQILCPQFPQAMLTSCPFLILLSGSLWMQHSCEISHFLRDLHSFEGFDKVQARRPVQSEPRGLSLEWLIFLRDFSFQRDQNLLEEQLMLGPLGQLNAQTD